MNDLAIPTPRALRAGANAFLALLAHLGDINESAVGLDGEDGRDYDCGVPSSGWVPIADTSRSFAMHERSTTG